ncbi:MAG: hypothetical protein OXM54_18210 [Acidimicrobiaceae bacterium]|nr:hypothetical protein [Acidimicrobiaceae bacterium]
MSAPRPALFSDGLVVLTEDIYADPANGAPSSAALGGKFATGQNGTDTDSDDEESDDGLKGEPLNLSITQLLKVAATYRPVWLLHERLEADHPPLPSNGGRPRECQFAEVTFVLVASWLLPEASKRLLFKQLRDPEIWEPIVAAVETAYPDHPTRRLRSKALSRRQFHTWRNVVAAHPEFDKLLDEFDEIAADASICAGQFPANAPISHPQTINTLTGDGKIVGARMKALIEHAAADVARGKKPRRHDPDALQYTVSYENRISSDPDDEDQNDYALKRKWIRHAGYHIAHISSRSPVKGIRIPQSIRLLKPPNPDEREGECTLAVDMALKTNDYISKVGAEVTAFTYDGGMYTEHRSRLLDAGIIPVGRVQRSAGDAYAERQLGYHSFKLRDGTKKDIPITALDATPSIQSRLADGRRITIGLEQTKLQWDPQAGRQVLFGHWKIPNQLGVPKKLRNARTIIQHNNTLNEIENNKFRTRALVPITENNPDFSRMHGHRQDSESLNSDFERRLISGRANAVTRKRFQLELTGYQHSCCIRALAEVFLTLRDSLPVVSSSIGVLAVVSGWSW